MMLFWDRTFILSLFGPPASPKATYLSKYPPRPTSKNNKAKVMMKKMRKKLSQPQSCMKSENKNPNKQKKGQKKVQRITKKVMNRRLK